MRDNTIFDDVFRTMMEKMTFLVVPLINDVFHTSYPADVEIVQLRNEYQRVDGEIITDSRLLIGNRIYHIECQSTDDTTMAVRMIEYDFATAVEFARKQALCTNDILHPEKPHPLPENPAYSYYFSDTTHKNVETPSDTSVPAFWKWMWFFRMEDVICTECLPLK